MKPKFVRSRRNYYSVPLVYNVELNGIEYVIFSMLMHGEKWPVAKQEVFDYLTKYPGTAIIDEGWKDELSETEIEEIQARAKQLFPEL